MLKYRWLSKFIPNSNENKLVVITGARQTGKTTLVKQEYADIKYINLDAPENREALRNISTASWGKEVGKALLDEAQKEPSIFEKVKYAYDNGTLSFSVLLGSAQILLLEKIKESLAGRVYIYEIWPLMVSELLTLGNLVPKQTPLFEEILNHDIFEKKLKEIPSILLAEEEAKKQSAEKYILKWGGMPKLVHLNDEEKQKWLSSYAYTYLERDLIDLARLTDLDPFRKFQRLTALRSGKLLNYSELAKDTGISVDSARRYLEYLRISYQTILLQPFYKNLTSSVIKSPKVYMVDIGILRQLTGFSGEITGEIYETYVVSEIYKWIKTYQKNTEIYFYRTRSGLEIDLILKTANGYLGLEIKSSKKLSSSDYNPLKKIASKLKTEWLGGICVYQGNKIEKIAEPNIWAIPSYRLFT